MTHKMILRRTLRLSAVFFAAAFMLLTAGCSEKGQSKVVLGYQYGTAYAPIEIMRVHRILEKLLPDTQIEYRQFGGPTPIREAMLTGDVTVGFMGVSPVIIGIDNGMPWKFAAALSSNQVALVSRSPDIRTVADFSASDRIAVLSPGCTQHILLSALAMRDLGSPTALDSRIVSMTHADAVNALLSGTEITAHFTTPPYIEEELKAGMHLVEDGADIMEEPFTFISAVAMDDLFNEKPEVYKAFLAALDESVGIINDNIGEAAQELAPVYGIDENELLLQMTYNGTIYSTELQGIQKMCSLMRDTGFISRGYFMDELAFPSVGQDR